MTEEGDLQPEMTRWIEMVSERRPYMKRQRDFRQARTGLMRARSSGVIPAVLANALEKQLDSWEADL